MKPVGAAMKSRAAGTEALPGTVNYFVGSDRSKWRAGVTAYSGVVFPRVYPGIDLDYHIRNGHLEYDFVVDPGGNPGDITLEFSGARKIELDRGGNLVFVLPGGTVQHRKPEIYQTSGGERRSIEGSYVLAEGGRVRFEIANYDARLPLVIDPVISYSTFLGGSNVDGAFSVSLDRGKGNTYVAGVTASANLPRSAGAALSGASDAFVAKLNPAGGLLPDVSGVTARMPPWR